MKIEYIPKRFTKSVLATIESANQIIEEYTADGYELTLRQLYYQFVSRDLIPNTQREYKKLGDAVNNGRLAGLISWQAIVDRTRNLEKRPSWDDPKDFMDNVIPQFKIDYWKDQPRRVEVWIEKDALVGVIERVCRQYDVPYFSCRGYTSQSEMWAAGQRLKEYSDAGQQPIIIHLGDHDPSGKDMTRDIESRLQMFCEEEIEVNRIALNMNQVEEYSPPPNPAKMTDARAEDYVREFGRQSWELDALDPKVLSDLIEETIKGYLNGPVWTKTMKEQKDHTGTLLSLTNGLIK